MRAELLKFRRFRLRRLIQPGFWEEETISTAQPDNLRLTRRNRTQFLPPKKDWSDKRAWLSSFVIHLFVFVLVGLLWKPHVRGTHGEADRPVGIAVVHETNSGNEYFLSGGSENAENANDSSSEAKRGGATQDSSPPISIDGVLSELMGNQSGTLPSGSQSSNGLSGIGSSSGSGRGTAGGAGTKIKTNFFGVEGSGSSFVYVVDRSDSMNILDSAPLSAAKRELRNSIDSFKEYHQFQIVFYNDSISPLSQDRRLLSATDSNKDRAKSFLSSVRGSGGTEHIAALKYGLAFAPDVLFFLTDAEDPPLSFEQLADIQRRAERSLCSIHAIQFNVGPAVGNGGWIRKLAEMNRGTYRYVDVNALK